MAARIGFDQWTLAIAHLAAFVGIGLAWLYMNPPRGLPPSYPSGGVLKGAFFATFASVIWVSWPFLVSFFVSRTRLSGRRLATWIFVGILAASTLVVGYFLNWALTSATPRQSEFVVAVLEALLLTVASEELSSLRT
jgi:hypothetical protein